MCVPLICYDGWAYGGGLPLVCRIVNLWWQIGIALVPRWPAGTTRTDMSHGSSLIIRGHTSLSGILASRYWNHSPQPSRMSSKSDNVSYFHRSCTARHIVPYRTVLYRVKIKKLRGKLQSKDKIGWRRFVQSLKKSVRNLLHIATEKLNETV